MVFYFDGSFPNPSLMIDQPFIVNYHCVCLPVGRSFPKPLLAYAQPLVYFCRQLAGFFPQAIIAYLVYLHTLVQQHPLVYFSRQLSFFIKVVYTAAPLFAQLTSGALMSAPCLLRCYF